MPRFGESIVSVPVTVSVLRMARQVRFQAQGEFSLKPPETAP